MKVRHLVLGTAGHIDHGKSALVLALTGRDPDRLQEEKRRGITIDLGFADLLLDAEHVLSFVDVPGHERFVRHMVAGATGIDAVLLVVAADQGVQPQTREHLDICRLLGIERGVVALTKCDLIEDELRDVVALEVRDLLAGTFLEDAPLLPVSARTSDGLEALREALAELFETVPQRPAAGVPRLPVDRSFVMRGFGTVVTGTLVSGSIHEGDEVEILPSGKRGRIRGLQVHRAAVERAIAGQRTAVNLQGLDCEDVPRGSTLTRPGTLTTTRRLWARLALLEGAPRSLQKGGPVRFHQGTCERAARYRVLGPEDNVSLRVELYLDDETVLAPGDRFILRRPAPVDTVGGGTIVDVRPPRPREVSDTAFGGDALDLSTSILLRLDRAGAAGREPFELAAELALAADQLVERVDELERQGSVIRSGPRLYEGELWSGLRREAVEEIARFHEAEPLRTGISREDLRARVCRQMPQDAWRQLLEQLAAEEKICLDADKVAAAGHAVVLSGAERELAERIESTFLGAGLEPPDIAVVVEGKARGSTSKIVDLLVARGVLVRIHDGKLFHAGALDDLISRLAEFAESSSEIDVAGFKELAGVTRKHAIPLLEHLDAERVTRRVGNVRQILVRRGS
jgi:selenocysteine-specific elongation factor